MQLLRFHTSTYTIAIEHDGREIEIILPWDGCRYETIKRFALEQRGVTLPDMTQAQWGDVLQRFVSQAIADGADLGPLSRINRVITEREEPRRH